jgi:hypothetical protein
MCHTERQVSARSTSRLLTVLLLILAAFGVPHSGFVLMSSAQTIVCASGAKRRAPARISEERTPLLWPRPTALEPALLEQRAPDSFLCGGLFQRPPPRILLSRA